MNKYQFKPDYLASYCDNEFKQSLKGATEAEIEACLDAIISLFSCLYDRDIFIKAYTKFLVIRLLNKTYLSLEAEGLMIQKLKVECGHVAV